MSLHPILKDIKKRMLDRNQNWLAIITGATGTGKSYSAMTIAKALDPSFNVNRICFTPEEFLFLLNSGTLKAGNVIIFDEAGIGIPSREWYTITNKMINYVLQAFRRENLGVIFTVPSLDFIDSQTRKLFHHYIETVAIDRKHNLVETRFMEISYSSRFEKIYFKYPRFSGSGIKIAGRVFIPKPPKELIKAYEIKKQKFAESLYRSALRDIQRFRSRRKQIDIEAIVQKVLENKERYFRNGKPYGSLIMADFNVSRDIASKIRAIIKDRLGL